MKQLKTPFILLAVLTSFMFSGCKKESAKSIDFPNSESKQLVGSWNWLYSLGGFGGDIRNPKSEGFEEQVQFTKDGDYHLIRDGQLDYTLKYNFINQKSIFTGQNQYMINFIQFDKSNLPFGNKSYEFINADTLVLYDECYDCYAHIYVLEK